MLPQKTALRSRREQHGTSVGQPGSSESGSRDGFWAARPGRRRSRTSRRGSRAAL